MKIKHGMILAAGLGKRMQPLTLKTPKPLLEINNYTLLERAINLLIGHGVQEISINVHYLPDQIKSFINKSIALSNKFLLPIWINGFGVFRVIGCILVPNPAARIMPCLIFIF